MTTRYPLVLNGTNIQELQTGDTIVGISYTDIAGTPTLATVATSGAYADLSGKPTTVSTFTNDSGYITSSALTPYAAVASANTFSAKQTFNGSSSVLAAVLANAAETTTVSATAATGTIAFYPSTQSVLYYTSNAAANWTVNLAFSSGTTMDTAMSAGQAMTVAFLVTQGSTAYYNTAVQVDGTTSGVTTKWQGGAPTSGNASGIDVYTYTIIKTASATFTVLASVVQFK